MYILQMFVAGIVVVIGDHLVRIALETHTLVASGASDPVAPIHPLNRELATFVRALANVVLLHKFLEQHIAALLGLLTRHAWVIVQLAVRTVGIVTQITLEVVFDDKINLFATCGIAARYYLRVSAYVLIQRHV